eukprot:gnl/MRDRNA2_/MRDRNA2_121235_c0_seq1.p1 gnl/MRDRNA2_/MRDRNA2_121235_c0~~gnl/MRDRNA2_/MRDRNA2_121235_c0_seq1.p1  ORF type:complete len:143 (-),score=36.36 gnl/MRDRNA2_/MRDRNA2_121235_c0_seq1:31-459(-)
MASAGVIAPSILASLPTPGRGRTTAPQPPPVASTQRVEDQIEKATAEFSGPEPSSGAGDFDRLVFGSFQKDGTQSSPQVENQEQHPSTEETASQENNQPQAAERKSKMTKPAELTELDDSETYRKESKAYRSPLSTPNHGGA